MKKRLNIFVAQPTKGIDVDKVTERMARLYILLSLVLEDYELHLIDSVHIPYFSNAGCLKKKFAQHVNQIAYESDLVVFLDRWNSDHECEIEHDICYAFDIPTITIQLEQPLTVIANDDERKRIQTIAAKAIK